MESNKNPKLIAKNALMLLTRFFLSLILSFYSTRLTLQVLCDIDFGINNVIGGLISMFAVVSMPLTNSLQRFFNVEITKSDKDLILVFNTAVRIITILIIVMIFLYETVGLYIVYHVLDYPPERATAVGFCYQITAVITLLSFLALPFMALFYSKEMMGLPASIDLMGSIMKIVFLLMIPFVVYDNLITYSSVLCVISFTQLLFYYVYCRKKLPDIRIKWIYDKSLFKDMLKFSGWNSIESIAGISLTYLSNILINVFGGVLYNTANGLCKSINGAVLSFTTNVMKAVEPQITSSTVTGDSKYRDELICFSIKISLLATSFIAVFFYYFGELFLQLWLGHVPLYSYEFCMIMITSSIFSTIILPLRSVILATGKVKSYFNTYGIIIFLTIMSIYILLKTGTNVIIVVYLCASSTLLNLVSAIYYACKITHLKLTALFSEISRVIIVIFFVCCSYFLINHTYVTESSFKLLLLSLIISLVVMFAAMFVIGLNTKEKQLIRSKVKNIFNRTNDK